MSVKRELTGTVIVVLFCRFVDCVSLALKNPYGERSIKYVLYCIVLYNLLEREAIEFMASTGLHTFV